MQIVLMNPEIITRYGTRYVETRTMARNDGELFPTNSISVLSSYDNAPKALIGLCADSLTYALYRSPYSESGIVEREIHYRDVWNVERRKAVGMAKTLTAIDKMQGKLMTASGKLPHMQLRALIAVFKIKLVAIPRSTVYESYADIEWKYESVGNIFASLDRLAEQI